ncbi:hypothetical protein [Nocardioides marinisabuli]|uniref:hypothetical protein n=1 Tax=Nocardioides marinisabuli TaxID=419476 RepID=UPI0015E028CD|nr:hypothetical protein [Nocardioides marinisabuli]
MVEASTTTAGSLPSFTATCQTVGLALTTAVVSWPAVSAPAPLKYTVEVVDGPAVADPSNNSVTIGPTLLTTVFGKTRTVRVTGTLPVAVGSTSMTAWTTSSDVLVTYGLAGTTVRCGGS